MDIYLQSWHSSNMRNVSQGFPALSSVVKPDLCIFDLYSNIVTDHARDANMKLGENNRVLGYFEQKRKLENAQRGASSSASTPTFSIDRPHRCHYCSKICIDGQICKRGWAEAAAMTSVENPQSMGAVQSSKFDPTAIRLHESFEDIVKGAEDSCSFFDYLSNLIYISDTQDGLFHGSEGHDIIFCVVPKADHRLPIVSYFLDEAGEVFNSRWNNQNELSIWTQECK